MSELINIPSEILYLILSFLDAPDLTRASATCHHLRKMAIKSWLWKQLCVSQWRDQFSSPIIVNTIRDSYATLDVDFWRRYYIQKYLLDLRQGTLTWTPVSLNQAAAGGSRLSPRFAHSGTVFGDRIIYIGGQLTSKHRHNDIFQYDTLKGKISLSRVRGNPPNISKHTAAIIGGIIYVFGGYDGLSARYELFSYDPVDNQWSTPKTFGECPTSRSNHCCAVLGGKMYIFGGLYRGQEEELIDSNDLYYLDTDTMTWHRPTVRGDIPEPRCGQKMVTVDNEIYMFGGGNGDSWSKKFNDVHVFHTHTNTWEKLITRGQPPDSTTFASVWSFGRFLFVFGGGRLSDTTAVSNDLFALDTVTRHWNRQKVEGDPPTPRDDSTTNIVGDTVYLMHGYKSGPIDEFWSIRMSGNFYRSVCGRDPPKKTLREHTNSPMLTFSPVLRNIGIKLFSPLLSRKDVQPINTTHPDLHQTHLLLHLFFTCLLCLFLGFSDPSQSPDDNLFHIQSDSCLQLAREITVLTTIGYGDRTSITSNIAPANPKGVQRRWRIPIRIPSIRKPPQLVRWDLLGVFLSFLWGAVNSRTLPPFFRVWVYRAWAYLFKVNLDEVPIPLEEFNTLRDFFSRPIKQGCSPVDAKVVSCGEVTQDLVTEVKGISYSISGFLGKDWETIKAGINSKLYHCVLYLAPGDYHRIHSPEQWLITGRRHFPGTLFPIAPSVGRLIPNLLALNERVALLGSRPDQGFYSLTAVGAYNVGSMSFKFDPAIRTNAVVRDWRNPNLRYFSMRGVGTYAYRMDYSHPIKADKGEEIGLFNLGSTVVLIFESRDFEFAVKTGDKVRMGQLLGKDL
ncbi:hypothetical protein PROFUN_04792 [Planoprotostelium fungivorum]|uniref:phosphatidylserine decarboxylase n=1 Tax=Planoprotostelium fungivorum TaxID=1890364 RepID=A0A2P6NSX9_9EUKA|nr:hypothetical protein PROFUN_04792 [Planoprotostelium fungivorum]